MRSAAYKLLLTDFIRFFLLDVVAVRGFRLCSHRLVVSFVLSKLHLGLLEKSSHKKLETALLTNCAMTSGGVLVHPFQSDHFWIKLYVNIQVDPPGSLTSLRIQIYSEIYAKGLLADTREKHLMFSFCEMRTING